MRQVPLLLCAGAALWAHPALAADALKFGPPPAWVHPQSIPAAKASEAPVALLLDDQQTAFDHGKITTHREGAIKFLNAQGLTAGNVAMVWQPAYETVTVNKLHIIRGDKVIDVLAGGQTFTILRREQNLDAATLDGTLTATLQPEGLQVGDIIDYATTTEHSDPVMKGHAEAVFGTWDSYPIEAAHASLIWPKDLHVELRQTANLPAAKHSTSGSDDLLELSGTDVQPLIAPKGAPERFTMGRLAEASDFASWSDVANLFIPLFRDASTIPASGPLHDEVEKIRAASKDPKVRAQQALALVQDRVRYVALLMGQGGYVPAPAETTWSRRFGDCKGKTALLLGILHSLGIEAEPVLAQTKLGDMVADRLPMVALFNHVLVRARIGGKDYWLDGTRTGDTDLDSIEVPDFGWGLPLVANAKLVHMVPAAHTVPDLERHVRVDASAGIYAPAQFTIDEFYRGDTAVEYNTVYSAATAQQRDEAMHDDAKRYFDDVTVAGSSIQFDEAKRELHIYVKGAAKLTWKDGWFDVPTSSIGFDPDFDRPAGPLHDAPWAVSFPGFTKDEAVVHLPPGFAAQQKLSAPVHETLAGVEYARSETTKGDVLTVDSSARSVAPEVPYKDALAAASRLRTLSKDDVYLHVAGNYRPTAKDLAELQSQTPATAMQFFIRADAYLAQNRIVDALTDLNAGLAMDPKNVWALSRRSSLYLERHETALAEQDSAAALAVEPSNANLLALQAGIQLIEGKTDAAKRSLARALEVDPNNVQARMQLGWLLSSQNDRDGAIREYTTLIDRNPKNVLALAARALVYALKQDFASASKDISSAEAVDPNNPVVKSTEGNIAQQRGDASAVIDIYSKLIAENPKSGSNYFDRAGAYYALGKTDLALRDVDQAITLGLRDAPVHVLRANILMGQGKRDEVAREAESMLQQAPTSDFALVAAAKTYAAIGQRDKAMQVFDRALAIKPYAYIYVNRAQVRPASDVAGQLADVDEALKLEPKMPEALSMKASILSKQGKFSEAIAIYDEMSKTGGAPWTETQRALLLAKAGRAAEASQAFAAVRAKAKSANELNSLCWTERTAGVMLADAVEECREAVKLGNRNPEYVDSLGMALLKSGKLEEALAAYNESVEKGHVAASYMGRAMIYDRKGDLAHAQADFAQAKKLESGIEDRFADYGLKFQHPIRAEVPRPEPRCEGGAHESASEGNRRLRYCGVTSAAPVPPSSPASGRLSNTSSMRPKAFASSASRNLSRSIAFSISSSGWPVYFA